MIFRATLRNKAHSGILFLVLTFDIFRSLAHQMQLLGGGASIPLFFNMYRDRCLEFDAA